MSQYLQHSPTSSPSLTLQNTEMKNIKMRFLRAILKKWKKMGTKVIPCGGCEHCCQYWGFWSSIPKDVPKGHLVVYVGENYKRFVIKISLLQHPLFKALLDQAKDEYDFIAHSKLCIPCDESVFLDVLRCAQNGGERSCSRLWL